MNKDEEIVNELSKQGIQVKEIILRTGFGKTKVVRIRKRLRFGKKNRIEMGDQEVLAKTEQFIASRIELMRNHLHEKYQEKVNEQLIARAFLAALAKYVIKSYEGNLSGSYKFMRSCLEEFTIRRKDYE
jgi:hypothetical protein